MASVPNQLLFKSTPMHPHNIDILRNYNVLNSVFLEPPPPPDADIRDWGPQIQQILAGPRNILPDLVVDRKNGFVVATFPPTPNKPHLGMISKSVKEALHRQKFQGYPWELKIHYRELDRYVLNHIRARICITKFRYFVISWFTNLAMMSNPSSSRRTY